MDLVNKRKIRENIGKNGNIKNTNGINGMLKKKKGVTLLVLVTIIILFLIRETTNRRDFKGVKF